MQVDSSPPSTSISSISTTLMGSVLECIRFCLDKEEGEEDQSTDLPQPPLSNQFERDNDDNAGRQCCQGTSNDPDNPWAQFWKNFSRNSYQHIASSDTELQTATGSEQAHPVFDIFRRSSNDQIDKPYHLRTASTFDSSKDILTIPTEEIVFPGSDLQHEMAIKMSENLKSVECEADECVICMEGFSDDNPRMPTLCACGENKTYFHLPCLYQWIEQSDECPSCRGKI
eukprot:CAMPEP_0178918286 /NCGR_PEP_ID=MMETSP0786-20121207/13748_1 /TAXON_ID=186022 /ORGANISM="Thalassionema frauenfeldii, Strain CCMP 1798" /LENGTH=227 /DNA_ID=CAMNT_0020591991 /DNA_START=60 /DNA_END=740 /DNA_ORIENTATION=+